MALWILSRTTRASWYQKKYSHTPNLIINHPLSASSIYCDPWHPPYTFWNQLLK